MKKDESIISIQNIDLDNPQSLFIENVREPDDVALLLVQRLSSIMCTIEEICAILSIPPKIFKESPLYMGAHEQGQQSGHASLRRAQWQQAMKGNAIMQIFLGKNYLGQSDKPVQEEPDKGSDEIAFKGFISKLQKVLKGDTTLPAKKRKRRKSKTIDMPKPSETILIQSGKAFPEPPEHMLEQMGIKSR